MGPLGAIHLCHNRSEHLPWINFQIIIALVNNYKNREMGDKSKINTF